MRASLRQSMSCTLFTVASRCLSPTLDMHGTDISETTELPRYGCLLGTLSESSRNDSVKRNIMQNNRHHSSAIVASDDMQI